MGSSGTPLCKLQQARRSSQARGVRLDLGPLAGKHVHRFRFVRAGVASRAPAESILFLPAWCSPAQRGEPSPTTGWQGLPACNQAVQGMPLVMQPDASMPGGRPRGEVRLRGRARWRRLALASRWSLCGAGWQGPDAQPKKESAANDDGYHWRKCAFRHSPPLQV